MQDPRRDKDPFLYTFYLGKTMDSEFNKSNEDSNNIYVGEKETLQLYFGQNISISM